LLPPQATERGSRSRRRHANLLISGFLAQRHVYLRERRQRALAPVPARYLEARGHLEDAE